MVDVAQQEESKSLGRNQKIAIGFAGLPYLMNFALVLAGKLPAEAFWNGTLVYVSTSLGIVLGVSAFVKSKWGSNA